MADEERKLPYESDEHHKSAVAVTLTTGALEDILKNSEDASVKSLRTIAVDIARSAPIMVHSATATYFEVNVAYNYKDTTHWKCFFRMNNHNTVYDLAKREGGIKAQRLRYHELRTGGMGLRPAQST